MSNDGTPPQDPYGQPPADNPQQYGQPQPPPPSYPQQPLGPYGGTPYAAWGDRAVATLWDLLYLWPSFVLEIVGFILFGVGIAMAANDSDSGTGAALIFVGGVALLAGMAFGIWLYVRNYLLDQGRTGYTYGKRKVGIRTVAESTGQPAGVGSAALRWLLHWVINQAVYIDYLWPLWDDKKQTLTDKILGTVVIKQPEAR